MLSLTLAKTSILLLYLRVLSAYRPVLLAARVVLVIVILSHAYILATLLTACIPLDAFWDPFSFIAAQQPGSDGGTRAPYCHPRSVYWSHAGLNIVTDFMVFVLPLTVLGKIRAPRREKGALVGVFVVAFGYVFPPRWHVFHLSVPSYPSLRPQNVAVVLVPSKSLRCLKIANRVRKEYASYPSPASSSSPETETAVFFGLISRGRRQRRQTGRRSKLMRRLCALA